MKKEILKVKFNFSLGKLSQLADENLDLIDRDIVEFTDKGFTPARRDEYVDAINKHKNFPTDQQMEGAKKTTTADKDAARSVVETHMRGILFAAKIVFKENTGTFREFGETNLTDQTDSDLSRLANAMVEVATTYQPQLAVEGITLAKITELDTVQITFDRAIDLQKKAIHARDNSTENRAKTANALYDLLVKYADTGKLIWSDVSEAKYNDYIIYNTPSGTDESGSDELTGTVNPSSTKTITMVDEDATLTLSNTGTIKLFFYLSASDDAIGEEVMLLAGETIVKTTAEMSPDGDGDHLVVKNTNPTETGNYSVVINL
jgi:hypothetical protein